MVKNVIEEYGKCIVYFIIVITFFSVVSLALDKSQGNLKEDKKSVLGTNEFLTQIEKPRLICDSKTILKDVPFNPLEHVRAIDAKGKDISQNIEVYGSVDTSCKGSYDIRYTVRDQYGIFNDKTVTFVVD